MNNFFNHPEMPPHSHSLALKIFSANESTLANISSQVGSQEEAADENGLRVLYPFMSSRGPDKEDSIVKPSTIPRICWKTSNKGCSRAASSVEKIDAVSSLLSF